MTATVRLHVAILAHPAALRCRECPLMPSPLLDALRDAVGGAHVLTDPDLVAGHVVDWTGRFRGATPRGRAAGHASDEVAAVVRACAAAGVAIVPQGGNTGLVGGSVPLTRRDRASTSDGSTALGPVDGRRARSRRRRA